MTDTDFLVLGSGIAGLSFALKAAERGRVTIVTKAAITESNTRFAQGGISAVTYAPDTFERHIADTLAAGAEINDPGAVDLVVRRAPELIADLVNWGVEFDKKPDGTYELAREGGHTEHRILHHKDITGAEIERALVEQVRRNPNITILEGHFAIDLLTQHHLGEIVTKHSKKIVCFGAYILNLATGDIDTFRARFTVVATGGVGNVYATTTNPQVATGDGIAMVHRAKGLTRDMEFIQFHPTSLYDPGERPSFLISEAMRGFGAVLKLPGAGEFMQRYHPMGSLAPRDIVARSIDHEMKIHGYEFVYLDVTSREPHDTIAHFPTIYEKCLSRGIDITRQMIPVVPAAHYCTGGIEVNLSGESSINRLYALGECARTGLHGANRLASNSLIEAMVFADEAARHAQANFDSVDLQEGIPDWNDEGTAAPEEMVLITQNVKEMQQIMSNYVGIVRSNLRLERAMRRLQIIWQETEELYVKTTPSQALCELRNMITVGYLIIKQASARHESIGLHYSTDYPLNSASI
ncbi:MAG: L-aspartate oxidase [Alistipes sp.]|jgi:L-aspartate oxidase|nr:L-aspartate oxidase [Alistipes sp.]